MPKKPVIRFKADFPALRQARQHAGLSQEALAKKSGVSPRTIRRAEQGVEPSPRLAKKLAEALGVNRRDLF